MGRILLFTRKILWERHHRIYCNVQGIVNGNLAFEARITGTEF